MSLSGHRQGHVEKDLDTKPYDSVTIDMRIIKENVF
jgi:hypothetical protein